MSPVSIDHYENFPVASLLCPAALRPAVRALYAFARTADDLADEGESRPAERLQDLADYGADLLATAQGEEPSHRWTPVFAALGPQLRERALPLPLLQDLLSAFAQDVVKHSYADRPELLDYCRRSANPVGRLMLHLYGVHDGTAERHSDDICTALQLINFWQDFSVDTPRGRLYVPHSELARHRLSATELQTDAHATAARALFAELCAWTRQLMMRGAPLVHRLPGRAGWELRLVVQGGLRILDRLEALDSTPLAHRPTVSATDLPRMLWRAACMRADARLSPHPAP
jgi:hydroxysqualene synthase